jgi:hypothetical protein
MITGKIRMERPAAAFGGCMKRTPEPVDKLLLFRFRILSASGLN